MADERKVTNSKAASGDGAAGAAGARDDAPPEAERSDDGLDVDGDMNEIREELRVLNTKWMRALADLDNYKKRVQREKARWAAEAREGILLSVLDVVDDFERAVACGDDTGLPEDDPFRSGVDLILRRLKDVLAANDVTPIDTCGAGFDPNVHEAVAHIESDGHESDQVVEEVRRGYMIGDRVLRCSRVVVAK